MSAPAKPEAPGGPARNTLYTFIESVATLGGRLLLILLISRVNGPAAQGEFTLFITIQTVGSTLASLGLEPANMYWGSKLGSRSARGALFGNSLLVTAVLGLVAVVSLHILDRCAVFSAAFTPVEEWLLAVVVWVTTVSLPIAGLACAFDDFRARCIGIVVQNGLTALATAILLATGHFELTAVLAAWALGCAVCALIWAAAVWTKTDGLALRWRLALRQIRMGWRTCGYFVLGVMTMRLDTLVVGSLLGLEALGIYSIAAAAAEVFLLFPRSLVNATLTRSAAPGKPFDIVQVLQLLGAFLAVPMLLAAVVVPIALELLFGPRFHGVGFLSIVMLPGVYLFGLGTTSIYYLFGQGRSGAALLASFIGAVAKVAFSLALIPPLGTFGAALASSLAYALFAAVGLGALARHQETSIGKILTPDFGLASRLAIRLMRRWRVLDDTPSSGGSL